MNRLCVVTGFVSGLLITAMACANLRNDIGGPGWTTLLDGGEGQQNWTRVGDANWRVVDGALQADRRTGEAASFLVSKDGYSDFRLRVEFWASDDANSGVFLRCANPKAITDTSCYEANIFDHRPDPTYGTGAIVHVAKVAPMPKVGGKWSTFDITLDGSHLTVELNGTRTVDTHDSKLATGPIALQYDAGVVKFRTVQIKPL